MNNIDGALAPPAAANAGPDNIARRVRPEERSYAIPSGQEALLVRGDRPQRVLPGGRTQRVRGWFQPAPELYLFSLDDHFLPLWITGLVDSEGHGVNLSWRVRVQVADVRTLWAKWLRYAEEDIIPLPADPINARLADPAQAVVRRYAVADLRTDLDVRRQAGHALAAALREQLAIFGLELAAAPDPLQLRFQTDAELAAAEAERARLQRMLDDEALEAELARMEKGEMLEERLRAWCDARGLEVDDPVIQDATARALDGEPPVAALNQAIQAAENTPPPGYATPADVDFRADAGVDAREQGWNRWWYLSRFLVFATILTTLTVALISYLQPEMMHLAGDRTRTTLLVLGMAFMGLLIAWIIDQIVRWQAQRTAARMLAKAHLENGEAHIKRLQMRHIFKLIGASVGLIAAGIALYSPAYYPLLRVTGAVIGLVGAGYVIHLDWLSNFETAQSAMDGARRRIASVRLTSAQRVRAQTRLRANMAAECQVADARLEAAASLAYSSLRDRVLYRRIRRLQERLRDQVSRADALEAAIADRSDPEWDEVDEQIERLNQRVAACSRLAAEVEACARDRNDEGTTRAVAQLEEESARLADLLTRWQAVTA
jgi:hypothetical protein